MLGVLCYFELGSYQEYFTIWKGSVTFPSHHIVFFYLLSFSFEVFLSNLAWGTYTQYSQSEIQRETMHNRNSTVAIYMLRIKAVLFAFVKFEGSSLTTWGQKIYSCLSCTYFFAAAHKKFFLERPNSRIATATTGSCCKRVFAIKFLNIIVFSNRILNSSFQNIPYIKN